MSAGPSAEVTTVYHCTLGSDGKRYITGASVMMKGDREDLERVPGGRLSEFAGSGSAAEKGAARTDGGGKKLPGGEKVAYKNVSGGKKKKRKMLNISDLMIPQGSVEALPS